MKLRLVLAPLVACASLFLWPTVASAACAGSPSATHICVAYDGVAYTIDTGAGPFRQDPLAMNIGTAYVFEIDPASPMPMAAHPLYVTDSSVGAGAGTTFMSPISSGTGSFEPSATTPETLYYESSMDNGLGNKIRVIGGAPVGPGTDAGTGGTDAGPTGSDAGTTIGTDAGSTGSSGSSGTPGSSSGSSGSSSGSSGARPPSTSDPGATVPGDHGGGCTTSRFDDGGALGGLVLTGVALVFGRRRRARSTG